MERKRIKLVISVLLLTVMMTMAGCNRNTTEEAIRAAVTAQWEQSVSGEAPDYLEAVARRSSFEIVSIEEEELYTVNVLVKGIDLGEALKNIDADEFPQTHDEAVLNAYLMTLIEDCPRVDTQAVIYAQAQGDGYRIYFSETFVDAMSGKIYAYSRDVLSEVIGG